MDFNPEFLKTKMFRPPTQDDSSPEQKSPIEFITSPEIIDGKGAESLEASARTYELASGDIVIAGTDKGIGYKDHNEDRVIIHPNSNFIAVIDGIGGYENGEEAAEILANSFLESPQDVTLAVAKAREKMEKHSFGNCGAVFISARVVVEKQPDEHSVRFIEISQMGDAKLIIIKKDGTKIFESKNDSLTQVRVDAGLIKPDKALYRIDDDMVLSFVSPNASKERKPDEKVKVESGDLVLLMSDGNSRNLTAEDIAQQVKKGLSARELFSWISNETDKRMKNHKEIKEKTPDREKSGVYLDGYKSEPQPDNRALAILEIK